MAKQRREHRRARELRRGAEAAVTGVERFREPGRDGRQQFGWLRRRGGSRHGGGPTCHLAHRGGDARRGGLHLGAPLAPAPGQEQQHLPERRPPVHLPRREVGAGVERLPPGGQEHRHRPAAGAGDRLHHAHVDAVHVGPLLAVDLDVDEVLVQHCRRRLVLERLVLHHVAPVAGGVADRHEHRLVGGGRRGERLVAPRIPVDRVVGVLQQVGAALVDQAVGLATGGAAAGDERLGTVRGRGSGGIVGHGAPPYQGAPRLPNTLGGTRETARCSLLRQGWRPGIDRLGSVPGASRAGYAANTGAAKQLNAASTGGILTGAVFAAAPTTRRHRDERVHRRPRGGVRPDRACAGEDRRSAPRWFPS